MGLHCIVLIPHWTMKWKIKKHLPMFLQLLEVIAKSWKKQKLWTCFFQKNKKEIQIIECSWLLSSSVLPPTLMPSQEPDSYRNDSLTSQWSSQKFQFNSQLNSLCFVSTPSKLQITQIDTKTFISRMHLNN